VTTVEIKSGYALNVDGESRLIDIASEFSDEVTFLGAHVVPEEYVKDREGYVSLVRGSMLQACAPHSKWADVFCDHGAFDVDESRAILTSARARRFTAPSARQSTGDDGRGRPRGRNDAASVITARSSVTTTSIKLSAQYGGYMCCRVRISRRARTIVGAAPARPWRRRRPRDGLQPGHVVRDEHGVRVGDCRARHAHDFDDALWSATRGGATALRRGDVGHLGPGARADVVILDAPRAAHLAYRRAAPLVRQVILAR